MIPRGLDDGLEDEEGGVPSESNDFVLASGHLEWIRGEGNILIGNLEDG